MKKTLTAFLAASVTVLSLAGCAPAASETTAPAVPESTAEETLSETIPETDTASDKTGADQSGEENPDSKAIQIGSLKGPTSMGLVSLMNTDTSANSYEFTMAVAADELAAAIVAEKLDIALVPANLASVLYQKTKGGISVIDINTLGVLYVVSSDQSIQTLEDLKGKTVYLTGKGTTPDYVARYLLAENGLSEKDVTLEYKSEAAEVAAILKEKDGAVGLLPQPFVTVACAQNEKLDIVLDLNEEWKKVQGESGSQLITGVTIARRSFLEEQEDAVRVFLNDHRVSAEAAAADPDTTAELVVKAGIIEKAPIAKKAIPYCNITYLDGEAMKAALSGYLSVLFEQNPDSVGGALPGDDFYYIEN